VGSEDIEEVTSFHNIDDLPVYSSEQVAENDGQDGKPNWMTYGGVIYDVTDFIPNHPGGSEQILKASGSVRIPKISTYLVYLLQH
jgi:cytochrome b involved in lipid metabolism